MTYGTKWVFCKNCRRKILAAFIALNVPEKLIGIGEPREATGLVEPLSTGGTRLKGNGKLATYSGGAICDKIQATGLAPTTATNRICLGFNPTFGHLGFPYWHHCQP